MMSFLEIFLKEKPNLSILEEVYSQVLTHEKAKGKAKFNFSTLGIPWINFPFLYSLACLGVPTLLFFF